MRLLYRVSGPKVFLAIKHKLDAAKRAKEFLRQKAEAFSPGMRDHLLSGNHIKVEELEFRLKHLPDVGEFELTLDECKELGLTEATPFMPAEAENVRAA